MERREGAKSGGEKGGMCEVKRYTGRWTERREIGERGR